jgi:N-acetylmuramic acid 6-phosphate etherase
LEAAIPGSPGIAIPGSLRAPQTALVLGIDGGGSKTLTWLATRDGTDTTPAGIGEAGPSNPQSVGWAAALANIDRAIQHAFLSTGIARDTVAAACLAIAGAGRDAEQARLRMWATQRRIGEQLLITHDALPILAAGSRNVSGVALICGTGSMAFACDDHGNTARAGGWGFLMGDEGSGYDIARQGLRAAARDLDGKEKMASLSRQMYAALGATSRDEFVREVYRRADDRQQVAALAQVVLDAAVDGDSVADEIVNTAAKELADLVVSAVSRLPFPVADLALGGGLLVHSELLQKRVLDAIRTTTWKFDRVGIVREPVAGTVILARQTAQHSLG